MSRPLKEGALVVIQWADAWGKSSWTMKEDLAEDTDYHAPIIVRTVGWVKSSNKDGVLLLASVSEHGGSPLMQFIPSGMIQKVEKINNA